MFVTFIPCTNTKVVSEAMMLGTKSGSAEPTKFSFPSPLIRAILIVRDTEHCPESSPAVRKKEAVPATTGRHQEQQLNFQSNLGFVSISGEEKEPV